MAKNTDSKIVSGHQIIRRNEAAVLLGFTPKHMHEMWRKGELPPRVQLGPKSIGWRLKDLEAWIDSRIVENVSNPPFDANKDGGQ
jgi:predicted DNA-binding transcriptional regulator AlpA